jgi:HK97 family phage major capsid protein
VTRDERQQRIEELERWVADQHAEFADEGFPEEVREAWDKNNAELRDHRAVMKELAERDERVRQLAERPENREGGSDQGNGYRRGQGVQIISRMSESEVYDLNSIRTSPLNPELGGRELRDRAMRAVELAYFPHERAQQDQVKAHIQRLLDTNDSADKEIARRILVTGGPIYRAAFGKYLKGQPRTPEEERALSVGTGSAGGFAVVYTLDPTIIPTSNFSVNPWRAIGNVESIAGTNEWRGVTSAGVSASRVATEGVTEATDAAPTLAQPALVVSRVQVFIPFSIEIGQDWGGLQAAMAQLIQDAKDDEEATAFATGNGTAPNPQGVITGATTTVTAGGVASFAVADVYKLWEALGARFRPRATYVANLFTFDKIRQFDTAGGASIWVQNLQQGIQGPVRGANQGNTGSTLLSRPSYESTAMASALTTGSKILIVGDFSYYKIVDRIGLDVEVIPHLFGSANRFPVGNRAIFAYWRNYGKVLDANAFRVLVTG